MTDKDIIKALGECTKHTECEACHFMDECYNLDVLHRNALDLITRQKTENENLKVENQSLRSAANSLKMHYEEAQAEIESLKQRNAVCEAANRCIVWQRDRRDREIEELHSQIEGLNIYKSKIKAEAYKEFAEKLKEKIGDCHIVSDGEYCGFDCGDIHKCIDNLLKEMVGENND